jgi:hypothetical protein
MDIRAETSGLPVHSFNLRYPACIRFSLLVVLIPVDDRTRVPGRGHSLYRLLWPLDVALINIPTEVGPNTGQAYGEFISVCKLSAIRSPSVLPTD